MFQDREKLSYLAGIIDGEGCFYLETDKREKRNMAKTPRIIVVNTNKDLMDWLKENFGGCVAKETKYENRKQAYRWIISGNKALMLANLLKPLLVVKRNEIEKLYENKKSTAAKTAVDFS